MSVPGRKQAYAWRMPELFLRGFLVFYVRGDAQRASTADPALMCSLRPMVHYVPVSTLDELPRKVRWARANDALARRIAAAGQERMRQLQQPGRMARALLSQLRGARAHAGLSCPAESCTRLRHEFGTRRGARGHSQRLARPLGRG